MKINFKLISLVCLVSWHFGQMMESDSDQPVFPEFVSLIDDEDGAVGSELNISALDRMLNPEDFGAEFRYVCFFV